MTTTRKALLLPALLAAALAQGAIYVGTRLTERAAASPGDPGRRIALLERAARFNPWDDAARFELGKAWYEAGDADLGDAPKRDAAFAAACRSFVRALRLNPGNLPAHLELARTLLYMDYLGLSAPSSYFEEYVRAARLAGSKAPAYFEVAQVLLSRWESLAAPERAFTTEILRKSLSDGRPDRLDAVLRSWEMNGRDYALMDAVLPQDPRALRAYAEFLGARSLSLEGRRAALARAEAIEFAKAREDVSAAARLLEYYQLADAGNRITEAVGLLEGIRGYQDLAGEELFPAAERAPLLAQARLLRARRTIEETGEVRGALPDLDAYVAAETDVSKLSELERSLRDRELLPAKAAADMKDLPSLVFALTLAFRQNRYDELTGFGRTLEGRFLSIPPAQARDYARLLRLLGDAFLKLDFIYDAERFVTRSLEVVPDDPDSLIRLRRIYARMNDEARLRDLDARLASVLTPREIVPPDGGEVGKGRPLEVPVLGLGGPARLSLTFAPDGAAVRPLVSVFHEGRILWDGYLGADALPALQVDLPAGRTGFEIRTANAPARVLRIELVLGPAPGGGGDGSHPSSPPARGLDNRS